MTRIQSDCHDEESRKRARERDLSHLDIERGRERSGHLCRLPSLAREVDSVCLSARRDENSYDNDQGTLRDYPPRIGRTCLD